MGTGTDPCPHQEKALPGWRCHNGTCAGMGIPYRFGDTERDGGAITGPVPGQDGLYRDGELVPGWTCCNGACPGIGGSVPGWDGCPVGDGGPISGSVTGRDPMVALGDLSQHRAGCGVTAQPRYWIAMSCTGVGSGTGAGCPIRGWEIPSQPLSWDGARPCNGVSRTGTGDPKSAAVLGSGSEIPYGSSCRDGSSVPGWDPALGQDPALWGSVPCWGH